MAISKKVEKAFNDQMNREFYSFYLYLAMAGYFEATNLKGFANWMRIQAEEERTHAMRFYDFIANRSWVISLNQIDRPGQVWKSPLDAFSKALAHEQFITANTNELADLSLASKDHAAHSFLKFFIDEQIEEEAAAQSVVGKLKLIGKSASGMFMLDNELGQRAGAAPAAPAQG